MFGVDVSYSHNICLFFCYSSMPGGKGLTFSQVLLSVFFVFLVSSLFSISVYLPLSPTLHIILGRSVASHPIWYSYPCSTAFLPISTTILFFFLFFLLFHALLCCALCLSYLIYCFLLPSCASLLVCVCLSIRYDPRHGRLCTSACFASGDRRFIIYLLVINRYYSGCSRCNQ